ncbi:MAG: L,D-transpeptidase, partial [Rhodospirillales bacterium]|nr:L,D-transpeptidase [Rhodospirillales bacterium]
MRRWRSPGAGARADRASAVITRTAMPPRGGTTKSRAGGRRGGWWNSPWDDPYERGDRESPDVVDGGARPSISPIAPELVPFASQYAPGSIVIETRGKQLFFVKSSTEAYRYPISVGRDGFTWNGTEKISRIAEWPDWHPPAEMRERDPNLPVKMTGGLRNPLGAKAIYLGNTLYRIHGTNDAKTIGQAASSGCFRMLNGQVIDLAERVQVGASVTVVERLPAEIARALPPLP